MSIYLTLEQIRDLADYAGLTVADFDEEAAEQEFYISRCPKGGVMCDDEGIVKHYALVVTCDGCERGECMPLGKALLTASE